MAPHIIDVAPKGGEVMARTSTVRASGTAPGQRKLNGPQTTGREYRSLSEPEYGMRRDDDVPVPMRDGVRLLADVHRPDSDGRFPALIAASPYPRQIQDLGAPMGFIEAGASDFLVPRGYVHVIANLRGTGGSDGTLGCFDATGTPGHVRPRRVDGRAAVVRRERRDDRYQLLRHDSARGGRRAPTGTQGDLPGCHTISSASRLLFPVLDESDGGLDA